MGGVTSILEKKLEKKVTEKMGPFLAEIKETNKLLKDIYKTLKDIEKGLQ